MDDRREQEDFDKADQLIQSRQRYFPRAKKAQDVINQLLARRAVGQQQASDQLVVAWRESVDARWHKLTFVGKINRGVLEINVANSTMVQHLNFQKAQILERMVQRLPQNKLKDIRFKVGPIT